MFNWKPVAGLVSLCAIAGAAFALEDGWEAPDLLLEATDSLPSADQDATGLSGGLPNPGEPAPATTRTFYVDYDTGSNAGNGGASAPWKHAPGDAAATGVPATFVLQPGDVVRFKGGVRYRGSLVLRNSGVSGSPITYSGQGYGTGRAIFDGADAVTSSVPCPSAAACGGAANWASLVLVTYTTPPTANLRFYDSAGTLFESQYPAPQDNFRYDEVDSYVTIPLSQAAQLAQGVLVNAALANAARTSAQARVLIWVSGNAVVERQILSISGSTIYFDATDVTPYTDRDSKAAVIGVVSGLNAPGKFARLSSTKAVVYPRAGGGALTVGNGRVSFDLRGKSNIAISGFRFEHGTAAPDVIRQGVAIANYGGTISNITIENNEFAHYSLRQGYGVIQLATGANFTIRNNLVTEIHGGSGFRLGTVTGVLMERNRLHRIGRTAVLLNGSRDATVRSNIISDVHGVHGNGLSVYQDSRNVLVESNCIFDAVRPLTYHGDGDYGTPNGYSFTGNILITDADGRAAIYSWGSKTVDVLLENNVALSPVAGMILNVADREVEVRNNIATSILSSGGFNETYTIGSNTPMAYAQKGQYALSTTACSGPGYWGQLSISAI